MIRWRYILFFFGLATFSQAQDQRLPLDDLYPEVSYELIEDRLRCIERTIPLHFNERVQSFVDYFTVRNREYMKEIISKKNVFFPIFEDALARYGLPDELKYLSVVESGLRPNALSRAGAGGLWQFMPATGKSYGLKQSWYIDERMNPWAATDAACRYMKMLYSVFGDWELALAAYNTGPGNVRKAIRRSGYKNNFWEIYKFLPRETRSYVPQFVAVTYSLKYAEAHNFVEDEINIEHLIEFDTLLVSGYIHLETLSDQLGLCLDDMIKLNPQIIRGATPDGTSKYPLKIPKEMIDIARANRLELLDSAGKVGKKELERLSRNSPGSTYGRVRQVYRVRRGDVLGTIAERYHVRLSDIKKWNRLSSNMIYVGQRLNIWVLPHYNTKTKINYKARPVTEQTSLPANGKYHTVQDGDSLWSISRKYSDLSIDKLKKLNNLTSNTINPGQRLLIGL